MSICSSCNVPAGQYVVHVTLQQVNM